MKISKLLIVVFGCLISGNVFAQSPKDIEADLLKSLNKINYLAAKRDEDTTGTVLDSLVNADSEFTDLLEKTLTKYPATLNTPFHTLADSGLFTTSPDGKLRIYAWDSQSGGQQKDIENIFQFKTDSGSDILTHVPQTTYGSPADDYNIQQCILNGKTYYFIIYESIVGGRHYYEGIMTCAIEQNKLNTKVKLIKTSSGLHNQLHYEFHHSENGDDSNDNLIFDEKAKKISLPVVNAAGELTSDRITYKFTGQYFEKVK